MYYTYLLSSCSLQKSMFRIKVMKIMIEGNTVAELSDWF